MQYNDIQIFGGAEFALRQNKAKEAINLHYHDHFEFFYIENGGIVYSSHGINYNLSKGDLLIIPPFTLHQLVQYHKTTFDRLVLHISVDKATKIAKNISLKETQLMHLNWSEQEKLTQLLKDLLKESEAKKLGYEIMQESLISQILVLISRNSDIIIQKQFSSGKEDLIGKCVEYIDANYMHNLSLESIADYFYLDKYNLSHRFSQQVGSSLYQYIIKKRLLEAIKLMEKGISINEASNKSGFNDYTNFYKCFKKYYGVSPRIYKKNL